MQLGAWAAYLDEPEMAHWYRLPPSLEMDWQQYRPDGRELEPLPAGRYEVVWEAVRQYTDASVAALNLPYHNPTHFGAVWRRGRQAKRKLEELTGRSTPLAVSQALGLSLYAHDCHHCGSTFRADTPWPERLFRPEWGRQVTAEWVSAAALDELSQQLELPVPWRLFQTQVIWCSTYGAETPRGREIGVPPVRPQGLWGRLMKAADIAPPPTLVEWMLNSLAVQYGEVPAAAPPASWEGLVQRQLGFGRHVAQVLTELDAAAGVPLTQALGWRDRLSRLTDELAALRRGDGSLVARLMEQDLAIYGVDLP